LGVWGVGRLSFVKRWQRRGRGWAAFVVEVTRGPRCVRSASLFLLDETRVGRGAVPVDCFLQLALAGLVADRQSSVGLMRQTSHPALPAAVLHLRRRGAATWRPGEALVAQPICGRGFSQLIFCLPVCWVHPGALVAGSTAGRPFDETPIRHLPTTVSFG